ncbi:hypothetical protein B0H14DRAFT_3014956 [Mycena olivaceomarginata]|nr:hypothetical protein B0H14DRAFT_3014956 [Mycena olivaceomarginata]
MLFPHRPCLSCSLFLAFSSLRSACFSPITHEVRAFPPSPMFVLLTFSRLLVSRECVLFPHHPCFECVLFPHHPCLSCSLFLTFLSLGNCKTFHSLH